MVKKRINRKNKTQKANRIGKKKRIKIFYPGVLVGSGAYKEVFNITPVLSANTKDDVLTQSERESMGIVLDDGISNNVVMVRPNTPLTEIEELEDFVKEMKLQARFADLGLAPKVLEVNSELKSGAEYTPYAYTYRCNFNLCDYEFSKISSDLKKLFDGVAEAGYIYTDIKQANMCEFNVLRKNKLKSKHFVFVDFDETFVYPYKGTKLGFGEVNLKEIVSDIMEFMFIAIEMNRCGNSLNCVFCNNSHNMARRLLQLMKKYEKSKLETYPMISESGFTLLDLIGVKIPLMSPLKMVNHYFSNKVRPNERDGYVLYKSVMKMLQTESEKYKKNTKKITPLSRKSKTKTKSKSMSERFPRP